MYLFIYHNEKNEYTYIDTRCKEKSANHNKNVWNQRWLNFISDILVCLLAEFNLDDI